MKTTLPGVLVFVLLVVLVLTTNFVKASTIEHKMEVEPTIEATPTVEANENFSLLEEGLAPARFRMDRKTTWGLLGLAILIFVFLGKVSPES